MKNKFWSILSVLAVIILFSVNSFSWTTSKRLTWNSGTSWSPKIAIDTAGTLHIVWYDYTYWDAEIFYKKSTDGGLSWASQRRLTWDSVSSQRPMISADSSGVLHVIWLNEVSGNYHIFYKQSTNSGNTWSSVKRISYHSGDTGMVSMIVDS